MRLAVAACAAVLLAATHVPAASAQGARATASLNGKPQEVVRVAQGARPRAASKKGQKTGNRYYVDFRARTAASYGHAFVWYGKINEEQVEVAGLHPAGESVIPYIMGHVLFVPAETGASYGDLDEQYLTASYRVTLNEADAEKVFAYIKHRQANSPVWNAAVYNCVAFIRDIASFMGLQTPASHLLYPEDWVNQLRELNGGRKTVSLSTVQ